jgi:hypothetical protein
MSPIIFISFLIVGSGANPLFSVTSEDIVKAMIDPNHKAVHGSSGYGNMPPMRNVLPVQQQQQHASYGSLPQLLPVSVSVPSSTPELEAAKVSDTAAPKAYSGPSVHTFGFGSDHDANMLKYVIS